MTSAPSTSAMAIERDRRLRFCASVRTMPSSFSSMSSPAPSRPVADQTALDQKDGEQQEQIEDREAKQLLRRRIGALALALAAYAPGQRHHREAGNERDHAIDRIRIAQEPGRSAERDQHERVEEDLPARLLQPSDDWEHRDARPRVVV